MRNFIFILSTSLLLISIQASISYAAKDTSNKPAPAGLMNKDTINKIVELSEPSQQHGVLRSLIGIWYYTLKYWEKEGSEAQTSSGTMINEMILANQYLSRKTSLILNIGGQTIPYEGQGMIGLNKTDKKFTSVWADTMLSDVMHGTGSYNEEQKTLEEKGRFTHPFIKGERAYRSVIKFIDEDAYTQTIFIAGFSGKEFKVLEIEFQKRK